MAPGTMIGGYRIISPLGSGAMGTVYRARDADGLEVAMKTLHPSVAADPQSRQRLQREIAVLSKIRNKGVARVIDAEADGDEMFIVTELIDGPTLESVVADNGPFDAHALSTLAEGLRDALNAVHVAGVIHRDLKASNVLMSARGPVLIDFGIAQIVGDARVTKTGLVMGTPAYLAPELVDGAEPSMTTDWWGWAGMLAYAATGRAPFGVRPIDAVLARARSGKPDLAGLGPRTERALRGALDPVPENRTPPAVVVEQLRMAYLEGDARPDEVPSAAPDDDATAVLGGSGGAVPGATTPYPAGALPQDMAQIAAAPGDGSYATEDLGDGGSTAAVDPDFDDDPDRQFVRDAVEGPPDPVYVRPIVARRTWTILALGIPLVFAGASWPGVTLVIFAAIWFVCRFVGVFWDSMQSRRESRGGIAHNDSVRQGIMTPWLLVRSVFGAVPALLVAGTVLLTTGGVAWWLLDNDKVVIGDAPGNAPHVYQWVLFGSVVLFVSLMWFGPLTGLTRLGARVVVNRAVPRGWGVATVWVIAAVASFVLWQVFVSDQSIVWSPLPAPPSLAG
ncbi:hypothetical protein GCM10010401_05390 [Rarobacter faecitabidus]